VLDDGTCSACAEHERRGREVDWDARARAFAALAERAKERSTGYDCVIPVSGGKDSTWQVVTCLEHGLRPLAVTWKSPGRTPLGSRNLANLVGLGVDHVDYQVDPGVERAFMRRTLLRFGSTAVPMHLALFAIPLSIAVRFGIPLVVWGENSAVEYCGERDDESLSRLTGGWIARYGVTHGTTARDWVSDELTEKQLAAYAGPSEEELQAAEVEAVFLGHFFRWDPVRSYEVASAHGFEARAEGPRTGAYDFADVDDEFISVHHYLKWFKFGLTRSFDNLSLEIRFGRLSREEAIPMLRERGEERPSEDIARLCQFIGLGEEEFAATAERFRNPEIWSRRNGTWVIEDFLVPDWRWS
jgi:N-acetyl sugar amidotransferase